MRPIIVRANLNVRDNSSNNLKKNLIEKNDIQSIDKITEDSDMISNFDDDFEEIQSREQRKKDYYDKNPHLRAINREDLINLK